jgi:hypothetical protein
VSGGRCGGIVPRRNHERPHRWGGIPLGTFIHLLRGLRSLAELEAMVPDCQIPTEEDCVLLRVLFPRRPCDIWVMGRACYRLFSSLNTLT